MVGKGRVERAIDSKRISSYSSEGNKAWNSAVRFFLRRSALSSS